MNTISSNIKQGGKRGKGKISRKRCKYLQKAAKSGPKREKKKKYVKNRTVPKKQVPNLQKIP